MDPSVNVEVGIGVAILLHFGAIVWWGSRLTTEMKSMRETMNRVVHSIERQQQEISDLYTKVAVQDAVLRATGRATPLHIHTTPATGGAHGDPRTSGEGPPTG